MRRISLALALLGATMAGCSGSTPAPTSSATQQGVQGKYYFVNLFTPPIGGYVVSDVGGISCGASAVAVVPDGAGGYRYQYTYIGGHSTCGTAPSTTQTRIDWTVPAVTLTATPSGGNVFVGWAGDCSGAGTCVLTPGHDKTVVAIFAAANQAGHPNWSDPAIHAPAFAGFASGDTGAIQCTKCHGADLSGFSIAPSCDACHDMTRQPSGAHGGGLAFEMHGTPGTGWSQGCLRCHTNQGFQDYVGVLAVDGTGVANNLSGSFNTDSVLTTDSSPAAYAFGPFQCQTCHNASSDPWTAGVTQIQFPSLTPAVTTDKATALCGTCHQARESTASLNSKNAAAPSSGKGLGTVSVTAVLTGTSGTTSTLIAKAATFAATDAVKGYTAIFTGNVTSALNGARATVTANDTTTLTFGSILPAAPANTLLPQGTITANLTAFAAATGGTTTTLTDAAAAFKTSSGGLAGSYLCFPAGLNAGACQLIASNTATQITVGTAFANPVAAGDRYNVASRSADSVVLYPTATGGTTTTLVDANRTWTVNAWANYLVYFQTGANAGLYRLVASNTATTLTLTGELPAAPAAGDLYLVTIPETPAFLDNAGVGTLGFTNSHYLGAAATIFGAEAAGWYQYPRNAASTISGAYAVYTGRNQHGVTAGKCTSCHDAHGLNVVAVTATSCGRCHFKADGTPVTSLVELEETRQYGFEGSIDGLATESLKTALDNNAATLYTAIKAYAANVLAPAAAVCYTAGAYPYFFADTNGNGVCDTAEAVSANAFKTFTPRLLRAAYNYNFYMREPGAWAHNPRYVAEILYDAIVDLNAGLTAASKTPVPFAGKRAFADHFGAANVNANGGDQFRDWDAAVVPNNCSQCHAGKVGYANYLANQFTTTTNRPVDGMQCTTCHAPAVGDTSMSRIRSDVAQVFFPPRKDNAATPTPNQVTVASANLPKDFPLCGTCHSGRENKTSIDNAIATNYGNSLAARVATGGTTTTVVFASTAKWSADRFKFARVTFTSGANLGTSVVATASSATAAAGDACTITWAAAAALTTPPAAADTFDVTFDATTWGIGFTNPHYLGAAGVLLGSQTHMLYEYPAKTYAGNPVFWGAASGNAPGPHGSPHGASCTGCHAPKNTNHSFAIDTAFTIPAGQSGTPKTCDGCHVLAGYGDFRLSLPKANVEALATQLYTTITTYATAQGYPVCYSGSAYPYWFADNGTGGGTPGDGICQAGEAVSANSAKLNEKAARAAFNFKWSQAEPGAYAHNYDYILQILIDTILDLDPVAVMPIDAHSGNGFMPAATPIARP